MTTLYISQFASQGQDSSLKNVSAVKLAEAVSSSVAIGATSAQSANLDDNASIIRLTALANCFVAVGVNPIASATSVFMVANSSEYFSVSRASGTVYKVAVKAV